MEPLLWGSGTGRCRGMWEGGAWDDGGSSRRKSTTFRRDNELFLWDRLGGELSRNQPSWTHDLCQESFQANWHVNFHTIHTNHPMLLWSLFTSDPEFSSP